MREATLHHPPGKTANHFEFRFQFFLAVVIAACALTAGCSTTNKPVAEVLPPAPSPTTDQSQAVATLPPPQSQEVQAAVKRVFKDSALVDTNHKPAFVAGDFNGDLSQDIAVVLKPEPSKIAELNEEFPAWILRDVSGPTESQSPRLAIGADEVLLAVIHGNGANGWRDQQATQTFLLKNAAGTSMEAQSRQNFLAANKGRKVPSLRGDVVSEVLGGKSGSLYYARATYSWFDPKTFSGEPAPRRIHGDRAQRMK